MLTVFFLKLRFASDFDFCGNGAVAPEGAGAGSAAGEAFDAPARSAIFCLVEMKLVPLLSTTCIGIICTLGFCCLSLWLGSGFEGPATGICDVVADLRVGGGLVGMANFGRDDALSPDTCVGSASG